MKYLYILLLIVLLLCSNVYAEKNPLVGPVDPNNGARIVNDTDGVPEKYDTPMMVGELRVIAKGSINHLRSRPRVLNAYAESAREDMYVVDATHVVGQMFKAEQDNINSILLTLESAAVFASMDAITVDTGNSEQKGGTQEYSSDAEMQEEWIETTTNPVRSTFTDDIGATPDGTYALQMNLADAIDAEWRLQVTDPTDLTGVTFSLKYAQNRPFNQAKMFFFISDGVNGKSILLGTVSENIWQTFSFSETAMTIDASDDGGAAVDMTQISAIGFRIDDSQGASLAYADTITYQAEPGSFDLELWDFGSSIPANNGTIDYTASSPGQYTEIGDRGISNGVASSINTTLLGGKRQYFLDDFIAGTALEIPTNTLLTVGNYYAILIKYVDTDITVYGPDTTFTNDYYTDGYAWQADTGDNLIDLILGDAGSGAYSDLQFSVFSTANAYVTGYHLHFLDVAGDLTINGSDASWISNAEGPNMEIDSMPDIHGGHPVTDFLRTFNKPVLLRKGGKFEINYDDDPQDSVTSVECEIFWMIDQ